MQIAPGTAPGEKPAVGELTKCHEKAQGLAGDGIGAWSCDASMPRGAFGQWRSGRPRAGRSAGRRRHAASVSSLDRASELASDRASARSSSGVGMPMTVRAFVAK
ncbi:hypothetical protein BH09MYX1_BH09MYX1_60850 [soil metagenome]